MEYKNIMVQKYLEFNKAQELITSRVESQAKVRISTYRDENGNERSAVRDTVEGLFKYVRLFNSIDIYDTKILSNELNQIEIIKEIAPFILPKAVRKDPADINSVDLLLRVDKSKIIASDLDNTLSLDDFINLQNRFRGFYKKDLKQDMIKLSDIKSIVSLESVVDRGAFLQFSEEMDEDGSYTEVATGMMVRYVSDAFVPVPLKRFVSLYYRESYYNAEAEEVLQDYLAPISF